MTEAMKPTGGGGELLEIDFKHGGAVFALHAGPGTGPAGGGRCRL